ncbi:hypothetical protein AEQ67_24540 [Pseudomonas sp. RIT-PI-q]|nr:hypothetical protein AEQ67_24540 [Pseudomonas sp. RIT-PI-q]
MLKLMASSLASQLLRVLRCLCAKILWKTFCGSWLASEGGLSSSLNVEADGLFAGKPAPTGFAVFMRENLWKTFCRSWLASEGGLSPSLNVEADGLFASKPAPTGFAVFMRENFVENLL